MAWTPIRLRFRSGLVAFDGEAEGAGGGSVPAGAMVYITGDVSLASNQPIPFQSVEYDSDGYWDAVNKQFTIPAGKDGLHLVGCSFVDVLGSDDLMTNPTLVIVPISTALAGLVQETPAHTADGDVAGSLSYVVNEAAGASWFATVSFGGASFANFPQGGLNGTVFYIVRLGDNIPLPL